MRACVCVLVYLQDEYKVVDRFAPLVHEVLRRAFVTFVELELLDDVRVSEDPQQNLLCDLERAEQAHLWVHDTVTQKNTSVLYFKKQNFFYQHIPSLSLGCISGFIDASV